MELSVSAQAARPLFETAGVMFFAASGVLSAGRKGMDLVGVAVIALATALGGGTLRDLLLQRHPMFWIGDPGYLWECFIATGLTLLYVRHRNPPPRAMLIADGLGLALFTIGGAQIAERSGVSGTIVVLMGVTTGAAGGVVRDVLSAEVPLIFRAGRLYASAALAGAVLYLALQNLGVVRDTAALAGMGLIAALRFGAIVHDWRVPIPRVRTGPDDPAPT